MLCRAGLVDDVDGFVWQFAVSDVARCQLNRGFDRLGCIFDPVMVFELRL
jgi:hypothetical protein